MRELNHQAARTPRRNWIKRLIKKDYPGFTAVMMLRLAAVGLKSKVVKPVSDR
jgi:hypothetical protein